MKDLDLSFFDATRKDLDDETHQNSRLNGGHERDRSNTIEAMESQEELTQLPNGKWACKHKCGDKSRLVQLLLSFNHLSYNTGPLI